MFVDGFPNLFGITLFLEEKPAGLSLQGGELLDHIGELIDLAEPCGLLESGGQGAVEAVREVLGEAHEAEGLVPVAS